jgi:hypothetical protein
MAGGDFITLAQGVAWCKKYREENPDETKAYCYSKTKLNDLINQTNCSGVRVYNAINDDGKKCQVLVGIDSSGNDLTTGLILDRGDPCPTLCATNSPLNEDT